eukprot:TRINITY_DN2779_c0_g2_i9.p1 TRINITY_DN2779_c0_g2~~TRINITY_DN2779_c0_g2_i9.p1  ORF type:complete len:330 (-),score=46.66 TRINITY_DN2779_c0_g2_i9:695-1657(-)
MEKLLLPRWRQTLTSSPILLSASRSIHQQSHSLFDDDDLYDPPFSKTLEPDNRKTSCPETLDSEKDPKFPLRSDLPFDFRYSYSEYNPSINPIGFREPPRFSPFGPGRLDRKWNGVLAPVTGDADAGSVLAEERERERDSVLGDPLTEEEVDELVERYRHSDCSRQINIASLQDKTGGKVIYRQINILLLYRGRYYDPKKRPVIPLMLWKPHAPIYPRLVKNVADGLTFGETKEMRNRGLNSPALMKLTSNGVYVNVVGKVREAFKTEEVVRLDCNHVETSDCKKIGVKLRDLVPCVPILFKNGQIILWRGKNYQTSIDQ